jgi:heme/copper-type cytochrome/quinol oxidase subunit 4
VFLRSKYKANKEDNMSTKKKSSLVRKILVTFVLVCILGIVTLDLYPTIMTDEIKNTRTPLEFWVTLTTFTFNCIVGLVCVVGIVIEWYNPKSKK